MLLPGRSNSSTRRPGTQTLRTESATNKNETIKIRDILKRFYTETSRDQMTKYAVFIAPTGTGYSAHVPDLSGCIAAGRTRDETLDLMQGAIEMHLRAMREDGDAIPEPSQVEILEVA